mgnify:CR=1 FL=1
MSLDQKLLQEPPVARSAYSDRTAWLMAAMSRLAYEPFEEKEWNSSDLAKRLAEVNDPSDIAGYIEDFRKQVLAPGDLGDQVLNKPLKSGGFRLVRIFHEIEGASEVQAFLAARESDKLAVLAFRGTQKNWRHIAMDVRAWQDQEGGSIGFREGYGIIKRQVTSALSELEDYKIYLTGHSLGGALATMAARHLSKSSVPGISQRVAACYSFGAPKIGDRDFQSSIKPPIYRVVHSSDIVPRLPFNLTQILAILSWLAKLLPWVNVARGVRRWTAKYFNHVHHGDLRWVIGAEKDDQDPSVIPNPGFIEQWLHIIGHIGLNWRRRFEDHAIRKYERKLASYARIRNR